MRWQQVLAKVKDARGPQEHLKHPQCRGRRLPVTLRSEVLRAPKEGQQRLRKAHRVPVRKCHSETAAGCSRAQRRAVHHAYHVP